MSVDKSVRVRVSDRTWKTKFNEYVEPLLERNRYRPKIAALCCTDPSTAAVLLGQAIVAIAGTKNAKFFKCYWRSLFSLGLTLVLASGMSLVRSARWRTRLWLFQVDATKTEPRVADGIAASTNDNDNKSNLY
jgi:hypothetical protein